MLIDPPHHGWTEPTNYRGWSIPSWTFNSSRHPTGKQGQRNLNLECFQFRTEENGSPYFTSYTVSAVLWLKYQWINIYLCKSSRSAESVAGTVNTKQTLKSEECHRWTTLVALLLESEVNPFLMVQEAEGGYWFYSQGQTQQWDISLSQQPFTRCSFRKWVISESWVKILVKLKSLVDPRGPIGYSDVFRRVCVFNYKSFKRWVFVLFTAM